MNKVVKHFRGNVVAYLALIVAMGGTSYAAFRLPAGSVGERELKNHSIDPVKLDPRFIGGYVRGWAAVDATGHIVASGGHPRVTVASFGVGIYGVSWGPIGSTRCESLVSLDGRTGTQRATGFVASSTEQNTSRGVGTSVQTNAPDGTPKALPFEVLLLC